MTANGKKPKAEPAPPTTLFLFGAHGDFDFGRQRERSEPWSPEPR
jgi:hypothetical protein